MAAPACGLPAAEIKSAPNVRRANSDTARFRLRMALFILVNVRCLIQWLVWVDCDEIMPLPLASQFLFGNCSRRAVFLNLPTEVRGISGGNTKASGGCHLAKD